MAEIHEMKLQLDEIQAKLNAIHILLIENQKSKKKLDAHIDFVEKTYQAVRSPVQTVLSYFTNEPLSLT